MRGDFLILCSPMHMSVTRFASVLFFFVAGIFSAEAQTTVVTPLSCSVTIDLQNVSADRDRVKVTVIPPAVQGRVIRYVLPAYLPGVAGPVDAGRFIHQFYALDDKGFPLKVSKKGNNVIVMKMRKGATLKKIEYWIDDTWDDERSRPGLPDEKFNYVPQVAGTNFDAGNSYVLNHAFVFGYIEGYSEIPYDVTVIRPDELYASSALNVTRESPSRDNYQASSYRMLVDSPVMYCRPDTVGFLSGNVYVSVSVYSENGRVSARLVRRLIAASMASSANFIPEAGETNYKLLFYFTTPFKTILNSNGSYGGLAHNRSAFYFLPELADEDLLANEIQRETFGDLLHILRPLDFLQSSGMSTFSRPQLARSWWFCQGVNMYFGWLAAVRDSFVSENEFMGYVSAKIRLAELAPSRPLTDVKTMAPLMKVPLKREAIRARAMLTAFLLDIRMTELTGGRMGLREAVLELNAQGTIPPDSLEARLVRMTDPKLAEFFREFVNGITPLRLIPCFDKIGWAYAPATIDSILTFGRFGLLYDDNLDVFYVHNADSANLFGLRDGDRIVSVNNVIVGAQNFDQVLHPIYSPKKDDEVKIQFIRNDQNMQVIAEPIVRAVVVEHLIRPDPAAGDDALILHHRIFSP